MDEYISREVVIKKIAEAQDKATSGTEDVTYYRAIKTIREMPSADVQPVDRWINCKDKMPDTPEQGMDAKYSDCCLVCDDFGWIGMGYYLTDGKKSWWEFADAQNKIKIDWTEITHWMPLPEPPKDGESK